MNEASALAVNCHTSLCVLSHPKGERKKEKERRYVRIPLQDDKFPRVTAMICTTLVNRHTDRQLLTSYTISSAEVNAYDH